MTQPTIHPTHYTGGASELKAATWFIEQGRQVYFPVVQQGVVDFVVDGEQGLQRVQVKTASWIQSGKNKYLQCRTRLTNRYQHHQPHELYDLLFIVADEGYWCIPANEIQSSNLSLQNTGRNNVQWQQYKIMS